MKEIFALVEDEMKTAFKRYGAFQSMHEAYAITLEEMDELWEDVKLSQHSPVRKMWAKKEAIQVAAMAIRLVYDCCDENEKVKTEGSKNGKNVN